MNMQSEEWRPVVGWEGLYEVSSAGRISWVGGPTGRKRRSSIKIEDGRMIIMPSYVDRRGIKYEHIYLSSPGAKREPQYVHTIVLRSFFCGPVMRNRVCRHLNGDSTDNRAENLYWGTQKQNMEDKKSHGTEHYGQDRHSSKLTDRDVDKIFSLVLRQGFSQRKVAGMFSVSPATICLILKGKRWSHKSSSRGH